MIVKEKIVLMLIIVMILCTGIFYEGLGAVDKENIELIMGGSTAIGSPTTLAGEKFAEIVAEKTNGKVKITYYPANELGKVDTRMEGLKSGSIDMNHDVTEWFSRYVKDFNILSMGFVFKNQDHLQKFFKSPMYEKMKQDLIDELGIRILAENQFKTPRVLISKKPMFNVKDLDGIKMRVPNIKMYIETWKALGTAPTLIPWGEAYLALYTGVVDAMEAPLDTIYSMKFHEGGPYITLTDHIFSSLCIAINEQRHQTLPKDIQQILIDAAYETGGWFNQYLKEEIESIVENILSDGASIIRADIKPFREKVDAVTKIFEEEGIWSKGLYKKIQQLLED